VPLVLLLGLHTAGAESLWSPDFRGYLSGGRGLTRGDTVLVSIDASSALSFSASSSDSKNLTLEFSGGEAADLFSFLPQVKSGGNRTTKGAEDLKLRGQVAAAVTDTDPAGRAMVQGTRSISIEGKEQSISVSGWVSPADLDQAGAVSFSRLGDGKLVFRTFLSSPRDTLSAQDITAQLAASAQPAAAPAAQPAGGAAPAAAAGAAPPTGQPGAQAPAAPAAPTLALTDARKKELLLIYLNRLVDVLFSK
jgi:flagellar L-ring protein FlgH